MDEDEMDHRKRCSRCGCTTLSLNSEGLCYACLDEIEAEEREEEKRRSSYGRR